MNQTFSADPLSIGIPTVGSIGANTNSTATIPMSPIDNETFIWTIVECIQPVAYGAYGGGLMIYNTKDVVRGTRRNLHEWIQLYMYPPGNVSTQVLEAYLQTIIYSTPAENRIVTIQTYPVLHTEPYNVMSNVLIIGKIASEIKHTSHEYTNTSQNSQENVTPYRQNNNLNTNPTPRPNSRRRTQRKRRSH